MGLLRTLKTWWERRSGGSLRDPSLAALFSSGTTEAGIGVTEGTALEIAPVWAAVRVISESVASLPLLLYRRDGDGRRRASDHPLYHLLHDHPNPETPSLIWRETLLAHALTWGNGYAEIARGFDGQPMALWILPPDTVRPKRDDLGRLCYEVQPGGAGYTLAAEDVFHLRGLGWDGLQGYSVIRTARESLGLTLACERFGSKWFGSGSKPSGVLEHPGRLSDDARTRLRNDWERLHGGLSNSQRVAILEEGLKFTAMSIPPEDAQFLATRQFQLAEVARWFNIPPSKLRDTAASSYASLEQENIAFLGETLRPWMVRFEQEIASKLLGPEERSSYYAEFLVEGLLRADQATRYQAYAVGRNWGWLSVNEIRARENLDPIPGGDQYLQPLNMQPLEAEPTAAPAADPSVEPMLEDSLDQDLLEERGIPARYAGLDFQVPTKASAEAVLGLKWREEHGRGGGRIAAALARRIASGGVLTPHMIRRLFAFFVRHRGDRGSTGWHPGEAGFPSAARISWALRGGDPAEAWTTRTVDSMDRRDDS